MASGYKDYQIGTSPEFVIMGAQQDIVTEFDGVVLTPGNGAELVNYSVPVNRRLYITSLNITADQPGLQRTEISWGSYGGDIVYWYGSFSYRFYGIGGLPIPQSQNFKIAVENFDTINQTFTCTMFGYLQNITQ